MAARAVAPHGGRWYANAGDCAKRSGDAVSLEASRKLVRDDTSRYSWNVTELALLVGAVCAPGVFYWWTGRHVLRRSEDPALPERMLIRQQHAQMVILLSCALLAYASGTWYWLPVIGLLIGSWIGDYPPRRRASSMQRAHGDGRSPARWHLRSDCGGMATPRRSCGSFAPGC